MKFCIRFRSLFCALAAALVPVLTASGAKPQPLFCDTATYAPLQLTWTASPALTQVAAVYPHPLLPLRAVAVTAAGLCLTEDGGQTWHPLPNATTEKIGPASTVVFHPSLPDTLYIGTQGKGIWTSADAGKSVQQLATTTNGLAADGIADLIVYQADSSHQTLLAVHGESGEGISRSRDGGKSWDVLNTEYFFRRILSNGRGAKIFLFGSTKQDPDVQNLYTCTTPGEYAMELIRDAMFTGMAFAPVRQSPLYVTTSDTGLTEINPATDETKQLGAQSTWAGIASTWGANADATSLCLYDPAHLGLVLSNDDLKTQRNFDGAPTGTFIKEGASIRPNANGTLFYAVANDALSIARTDAAVPEVSIAPAVCRPDQGDDKPLNDVTLAFREFSRAPGTTAQAAQALLQNGGDPATTYRQHLLTITARLPKDAAPASVTADLSRLGGSPETPLTVAADDNGRDARLYCYAFYFRPSTLRPSNNDWRCGFPGPIAIGVTASYTGETKRGAVGLFAIYPQIRNIDLWNQSTKSIAFSVDGKVTVTPIQNPPEVRRGTPELGIRSQEGPWSVLLTVPYGKTDLTGYQALSFQIKATKLSGPVYLQLRDAPELAEPVTTERVSLIATDTKPGPTGEYQTVVIPLARCIGESALQISKLSRIVISGEGKGPADFILASPTVLATFDDQEGVPTK